LQKYPTVFLEWALLAFFADCIDKVHFNPRIARFSPDARVLNSPYRDLKDFFKSRIARAGIEIMG